MTSLAPINQTIEKPRGNQGVKRDSAVWGDEFALEALLVFVVDRRVGRLSRHGAKSGDPAQVLLSIKQFAFTPQT